MPLPPSRSSNTTPCSILIYHNIPGSLRSSSPEDRHNQATETPWSRLQLPDWSWVMEVHFENADVGMSSSAAEDVIRAQPTWVRDNKAVVGAIAKTIHPPTFATSITSRTMIAMLWAALKRAHQDLSTRGLM
ncbi:hypothetical protein PCASD_21135 [Puccinia coronata f. sp. avenae]|uniref:Uncharacterized protein n=1 Tax=Puccinia coronata f. sp. avenae TaxID=200324 RepID=A0A2N5SEM5_9BASI|nr:hypothetical protein PCASD_21135 [Puccinia coronata f. sp. avenae]